MKRIEYSRLFDQQLAALVDFIAQDKPSAARRWASRLFQKMERLRVFPRSGPRLALQPHVGLRQLWVGHYRVIYRVDDDRIVALSISHGSKRIAAGDLAQPADEEE